MIQHTTMALAFANAQICRHPSRVFIQVMDSLDRYGKSRKVSKDWTAKLSYKTARYLASKGVPLQ